MSALEKQNRPGREAAGQRDSAGHGQGGDFGMQAMRQEEGKAMADEMIVNELKTTSTVEHDGSASAWRARLQAMMGELDVRARTQSWRL